MIFQPYVENAIWHGFQGIRKDKKISIKIDETSSGLVASIKDNGIGRETSARINAKSRSIHKSYGMSISQDRITTHNAMNNTKNSVDIIDHYDEAGQPIGSEILLHLNKTMTS